MRKHIYIKPIIKLVITNMETLMQTLSNGGDKDGNWSGETKERDAFGEGEEW